MKRSQAPSQRGGFQTPFKKPKTDEDIETITSKDVGLSNSGNEQKYTGIKKIIILYINRNQTEESPFQITISTSSFIKDASKYARSRKWRISTLSCDVYKTKQEETQNLQWW